MIRKIETIEPLNKKVICKSNYIDEGRDKGDELVFRIGCAYDIIGRIPKTDEYLVQIKSKEIYICGADDVKHLFEAED